MPEGTHISSDQTLYDTNRCDCTSGNSWGEIGLVRWGGGICFSLKTISSLKMKKNMHIQEK